MEGTANAMLRHCIAIGVKSLRVAIDAYACREHFRFAAGPRVPVCPGAGSPRYRPAQIDGSVGVAVMPALGRLGMSIALPCAMPQARYRRRSTVGWTEKAGPPARGPYRTRGQVPLVFTSRHGSGLHRSEPELRGLTRQALAPGRATQGRGPCIRGPLGRRPATSPRRALTGRSAPRTPQKLGPAIETGGSAR